MNLEIERKFLIKPQFIKSLKALPKKTITQGYLTLGHKYHTRVRLITSLPGKNQGFITSKIGSGLVRQEYEEPLSLEHVKILLTHCLKILVKERRQVKYKGLIWDIDYFPDYDLWVAEVELTRQNQKITLPEFIGKEVTGQKKYSNIKLARKNT